MPYELFSVLSYRIEFSIDNLLIVVKRKLKWGSIEMFDPGEIYTAINYYPTATPRPALMKKSHDHHGYVIRLPVPRSLPTTFS
jgi:hypothetical protein